MNFEDQFVTHCKIHFLNFASVEKHGSEGNMIDFCSTKNAVIESTINENDSNKIALRKIAVIESTTFKFLQIDFLFTD
jgi:hypothetical protein